VRHTHRYSAVGLVGFFVGTAELLLTLRVALRFFNGNPDATFVHWCYTNTQVLLEPFRGIFPSYNVVTLGWVVDYVAIFAMAVYMVAAYVVIMWLARIAKKLAK